MSDFADRMRRRAEEIEARAELVLTTAVELAKQSIQFGSPLTGAPGQPVGITGNLRNSWYVTKISPSQYEISSNVIYARPIENGIGPYGPLTLRSAVGGFHSVKLTVTSFDRIVAAAARAHRDSP